MINSTLSVRTSDMILCRGGFNIHPELSEYPGHCRGRTAGVPCRGGFNIHPRREVVLSAKIQIIAVGKIKEKYYTDAAAEYKKRLSRFCKLTITEVEDERNPKEPNEALTQRVLEKESLKIQPYLKNSVVIAMDIKGSKVSSERFSEIVRGYFENERDITFVVGGSLGLAADILESADLRLSMSDMTFPHQLARIMLIEQIYRAFKIIVNETYHK